MTRPAAEPPPLPKRPYPSLNYYDRDDRTLFAGRDDDAERFALVLDDDGTRVVVLHGESGSGKSSFLRAGVIPYLEEVCVGYRFPRANLGASSSPVLFVRATNDLAGQLAATLTSLAAGGLGEITGGLTGADELRAALLDSPALLGRALSALAGRLPYRLVLVVDQAEEVFTLASSGEAGDRTPPARALEILRGLADADGPFKVIVSLRTEYYGRLVAGLREGVRAAVGVRDYLLTDLTDTDLREAIGRPTRFPEYGFRYAPGLVAELSDRLIAATTGRQDSVLPLAQVICTQLYDRARSRPDTSEFRHFYAHLGRPNPAAPRGDAVVTRADLEAIGGVEGGMKRHAEEMVRRLFPDQKDAKVFRRLLADDDWPLFLRQPDGTLTTALRPAESLRARWRGRTGFAEVLGKASSGDQRLLRRSERVVGGTPQTEVSLGHDSLAPVASAWQEEFTRVRRRRRAVAWGAGSVSFVLAAAGVVVWMSVLAERAKRANAQTRQTLAQSFLNSIGQNEGEGHLNQLEVDALWQLAGLPPGDEEVRFAVLRDVVARPGLAGRLAAKAEFLTHAAVGVSAD